ncbi:hypothetical protein AVEN_162549-1 [Araneus ventricosus]|uniref:Uncharacterized protein n=1 Tax=Araneus ventricosus TaxID=182803 RepID=A0A4Y2KT41_ARAVE|nr:hypothetical protein AVEN_162549-1 [Araneus ventricosus]
MEDRIYIKRGTYNRFLRTDEPILKSTFYSKRKLSECQHANDTNDNTTYLSAFCDAEENYSCETSPHIDEDINFTDLEFDCINVDSTDNGDNDTNQNDDVKVNLANLNEPIYPSSSVSLLEAYISILAFSLRHNVTKTCMQDLLQLFNVLLPPSNLPELSNLSRSGFRWIDATNSKQTVTKVFPIICSSDAPAGAAIQNFIQYNGKYGCGFCQNSGERVEKGKGFCHIYPLQQPLPEILSFEEYMDSAEEASLTGKAVNGVKWQQN